jgi:hypothetical protein
MFLVEAALVAALGLWMAVAVYDNWRHAQLNRNGVAMVMRFDVMARDFPDDFKVVAHRRWTRSVDHGCFQRDPNGGDHCGDRAFRNGGGPCTGAGSGCSMPDRPPPPHQVATPSSS